MKRLFITCFGVSVCLVSYLVAGMAAPIVSVSEDIPTTVISCLGDSITNGYPYAGTENTYPARLQAMLEAAYSPGSFEVVNHGVNGYRADQVLAALQNLNWMAQDNPDFVLLLIGGNDLAQEATPSNLFQVIDQTVAEVQSIVDVVTSHTNPDGSHPRIIVSALIPVLDYWDTWAVWLYNNSLESNLTGMDLWITDNWDDFYDPDTGQARASLMYDTVHPNAEGYIVMAENWFEALNLLLPTPVSSPTPTVTPTATCTSTPTPTHTPTPTPSPTPTDTPTPTATATPTATPTHTPTYTPTPTPTSTVTSTPTPTPTSTLTLTKTPCVFLGDFDGDGDVDVADIMRVASHWHTTVNDPEYDPIYDLDNDGDIDIVDIMLVSAHWGETCESEIDKWVLWTNGTQLRGANIYQRRVYPKLDGPGFMGPGPVGPPYVQSDFDKLAALGANYVNISHPGLFTEDPPYVLDQDIQDNLDNLLAMIEQAGMFAVISFRTGPGRSEFTFVWDEVGDWFDESYINDSMWQDQAAQDAWVAMWAYTAQRYKDNPIVVGYDLMVEPNSNEVGSHALYDALDIWDPEEFYAQYGGTLYDWNQLYPRITAAIRQVDTETPILIGGNGYSSLDWLPYVEPTGDPRTVYTVHQYEPHKYTHQDAGVQNCTYPGTCDVDWDDEPETFDQAWLQGRLSIIDTYVNTHGVPVAVNEFGAVRWTPNVHTFMDDQMDLFEQRGLNYALWVWDPAWELWTQEVDAFNFRHGPDPHNHSDVVSSDLMDVIIEHWGYNTMRPSSGQGP